MGLFDGVSKFGLISGILTAIAFLFHIIGFAAPYWLKHDADTHHGLWYGCFKIKDIFTKYFVNHCGTLSNSPGWFDAVKAFETLGFLALLGALVITLLKWCAMKDKRILIILRLVLQAGAAGTILLGVIIFGAKDETNNYGFGFVLCIIAALISLVSAVFTVLDMRSGDTTG